MKEAAQTVALLPGADRFEDFHDKIDVSLETFRDRLTGGWLFNYVEALGTAGVRTVVIFMSARVAGPVRFIHADTGVPVIVLPSPRLHRKMRGAHHRFAPGSGAFASATSYLATPLRLLAKELRRQRVDVILCQEYEYPRFDVCVLLGRLLRLPVYATYQGADRTASWLERPFRRIAVRRSAGLIIGSASEARRIRETYNLPPERLAHIPNPMDVAEWGPLDRARARADTGIPGDARVVAWHGRVQIQRKGLDILLAAWEQIRAACSDPNLILLLVGSGTDHEELRRRLGLVPQVLWVDRYVLDRRELWRYLSAADVYALPSRHEGFPVAALEAMACGLPVVATHVPGISDLLPNGEADGGIIVPRGDPEALAAAVAPLLEDEPRARELGARARRRAEQEFSLQVVGLRLRRCMFPGQGTRDGERRASSGSSS